MQEHIFRVIVGPMKAAKIPCSVAIITRGEGVLPALEALKDFQEILICHGNPATEHLDAIRAHGAKLISQYDTDEPNLTCFMDKAAVRQRAMDASSLPWRFFMDRDDRLSPEAIEEIRAITSSARPTHRVWRMPTRVFIAGKEIKYEATYPSYQTRLVHESVGAHFKNPVHDRLSWDEKKFPVGTMQSFYDFHWSKERVADYWGYLGAYARREVQVLQTPSFGWLLWWMGLRVRTIVGYVVWRLPAMYLQRGFKNTMPLSIELTIVRYHFAVLFGTIKKYFSTRGWVAILVETLRGKDLNRILSNFALRKREAYGRVLDVGGGHDASYWRYLETRRWHRKIVLDLQRANPDIVANLEHEPIPLADGYCNTALMCNVLEHLSNREGALREVRRVLVAGGELIGIVPFLVGVHPDPHDYVRLTTEGLRELLERVGFMDIVIEPIGRGPLTASYYQSEFLWPRVLKLLLLPCILGLDRIILSLRPHWVDKFPLSYAFRAR